MINNKVKVTELNKETIHFAQSWGDFKRHHQHKGKLISHRQTEKIGHLMDKSNPGFLIYCNKCSQSLSDRRKLKRL